MDKTNNDSLMKYKNKWLVQPDAGLGNRLYCMYSAIYYSESIGRPFDMIWLRENCCNVRFEDLFETIELQLGDSTYTPKLINTYHLGYKNRYAIGTILSNIYMKYIKRRYKYFTSEDTRKVFYSDGEPGIEQIISRDNNICTKANGTFIDSQHYKEIVDRIRPSKEIRDIVDSVMKPYEDRHVYGVHIRRTDNKTSIENSPLELFKKRMQEQVDKEPDTVFYLASDDENTINELAKTFNLIPHKTFADKVTRDSIEGMKDAYVDMLCLSKCKMIFGSYGSSFSDLAALIGGIELAVVKKKL